MQNTQLNDNTSSLLVMASSTMEKQDHNLALAQAAALRCPRCDSANTKFCYFNNYSLSQPRHFCKACKRYWTRGGTLRNVPVGGGCRKNKRLKRPSVNPSPTSTSGVDNPTHRQFQIIDQIHPLVYKQQSNPPPPPPYDQLSSFTFTASSSSSPTNGFGYAASSGSSLLGSSGDAILSPAMATLLASTLNNKLSSRVVNRPDSSSINHHNHDFQAMAAFDGLNMKSERQGQECNFNTVTHCSNNNSVASEQIGSDSQSGYWNALWHDPGNIGPSVTSLI